MNVKQLSRHLVTTLPLLLLAACGGGDNGANPSASAYSYNCDGVSPYQPSAATETRPVPGASTTVIFMHGKTGHPATEFQTQYYDELQTAGYNLIALQMPWSGTEWDGTLCEGLNYLGSVVDTERAAGRNVIVSGHSMGGMHAMAYIVTSSRADIQGVILLAPGHMLHRSNRMRTATADDVTRAKSAVANGSGDALDTYSTYNNGATQPLTTTARYYLSYHDPDTYPNVSSILPAIDLPVLWLAGVDDRLTTVYDMASQANQITSSNSQYQVITGGHQDMLDHAASPVSNWLSSLGY